MVTVGCRNCNSIVKVKGLTPEIVERIERRRESGEHMQDIAPALLPAERELFISGMCGRCWNDAFGSH